MLTNPFLPQALLEEIERHGEKVEECQKFAKQYINAIKVRSPSWQLENSKWGGHACVTVPSLNCTKEGL
jgi:hypothetical protein